MIAGIKTFADDDIAPAAARWSLGESPAPEHYAKAANLGLTGLEVPPEHGGHGLGFGQKAQACGLLAGADFGFAMSVINTQNVALRLCLSAPDGLRDQHLPGLLSGRTHACTALTEPGVGSDVAALTTQARQTADGWVLHGEKSWIVNGRHPGLSVVFAQCGDVGDSKGIGAFLVDLTAPGVQRYAIDAGFSQTSMGTGGFTLKRVALAPSALLLPPGTAFKSILGEINAARTYVAAMCNGMLRAALDRAVQYGAHRQSFGKPLAAYPGWRGPLGQAEVDLAASEALTAQSVARVAAALDAQLSAARAKIAAVEACQRHLPALLHAMGAEGLRAEHCFTRHLAAAQIAGLTDGATNILRDRVARLTGQARPSPKEH